MKRKEGKRDGSGGGKVDRGKRKREEMNKERTGKEKGIDIEDEEGRKMKKEIERGKREAGRERRKGEREKDRKKGKRQREIIMSFLLSAMPS